MSSLTVSARLERSDAGTSWGFRMAGGKDFGAPLTIQRVAPGSLAAKCGVEVGDEIKVIGSTHTEGLRHSEAQQLIRDAGNLVELIIERGGSTAKTADGANANTSPPEVPSNKPTILAQSQTCNILPKPFPSQIASLESTGSSISLKQKAPNVCVTSKEECHGTKSFSATFESTHSTVGDVTSQKVDSHSKVASADDDFPPPPPPPSAFPEPPPQPPAGPPPAHSAQCEEQQDSDVPRYHGFVDPSVQSRSFKLLQSAMESGEDISKLTVRTSSPVCGMSSGPKPAIAVKPSAAKETAGPSVKPVVSRQYNSPVGLYSETKVTEAREEQAKEVHQVHTGSDILIDVPVERKTIVLPSKKTNQSPAKQEPLHETIDVPTERKKIVIPSSKLARTNGKEPDANRRGDGSSEILDSENSSEKKSYFASATMKLIQDQESERPQIQVNPKTGVEIKVNQSKKLIQLEKNLEGGFAGGPPPPPLATSYRVTSSVPIETKQTVPPSGTSQTHVGKAGEAKTLPAILEAFKIPVCVECGSSIRGPYVSALDKTWCPDHFVCANPSCRTSLVNVGFVEEAGRLYCERDYEQQFAPKCGKCGLGIIGDIVSAVNQKFHSNCFVCFKCHLPITDGLFHMESGEPYCEKDWYIMFQTKCHGCQFPIDDSDPWVDALSRMWHSDCFKCVTCQMNLDGQSFYAKNGKPYCKKHGSA